MAVVAKYCCSTADGGSDNRIDIDIDVHDEHNEHDDRPDHDDHDRSDHDCCAGRR